MLYLQSIIPFKTKDKIIFYLCPEILKSKSGMSLMNIQKHKIISLLILLLVTFPVQAQEDSLSIDNQTKIISKDSLNIHIQPMENPIDSLTLKTPDKKKSMGKMFLYDMGNIFAGMGHAYSRPAHWKKKQWTQFAATMAGTAALFLVDEPVHDFASRLEKDIPQVIQDYGWYYGSPQNNYAMTGAVYLTGLLTKNEKLRRTGVLLISSASAAGLLQQTSKYVFGRARPRSGDSPTTFDPFTSDKDYHSFPSGHMILAFTNAYAISKQFKNPWVKGGIIAIGSVPGLSRLWESAHWLSDVALSSVISIVIVESIDKYLDTKYNEKYNDRAKKVSWDLQFSKNKMGVVIRF